MPHWTAEVDQQLLTLVRLNLTAAQISEILKMPCSSVRKRAGAVWDHYFPRPVSRYAGVKHCHCGVQLAKSNRWGACSNTCRSAKKRTDAVLAGTASSFLIRKHLLLTTPYCSLCGTGAVWQSRALVLELDHIDGNHQNNALSNVRLLCPNCHSQTPTYRNKNKGHGRHARRARYATGLSY